MTVTIWVAVAVLPLVSVAVQVTVVAPSGNVAGASLATVTGKKSLAKAMPGSTATGTSETTSMSGGAAMAGGVVSCTVTR